MGFLLILPILVGGFSFCHKHPELFLKLHRYEGQYLYLKSAYHGIIGLFIAFLLNSFLIFVLELPISFFHIRLGDNYIDFIAHFIDSTKFKPDVNSSLSIAWTLVLSITMIIIVPILMSWIYKSVTLWRLNRTLNGDDKLNESDLKLIIMGKLFEDSPLDKLLYTSMQTGKALMVSLDDRKVYVGCIASMGEPNESEGADQEINFIPQISGYRDKDTLKVIFTTHYSEIQKEFSLVIKQERIISATIFDLSIYNQFQKNSSTESSATTN
ncbi:MAG: hypothetical protein WC009_10380 [Methylotenera sp.]